MFYNLPTTPQDGANPSTFVSLGDSLDLNQTTTLPCGVPKTHDSHLGFDIKKADGTKEFILRFPLELICM